MTQDKYSKGFETGREAAKEDRALGALLAPRNAVTFYYCPTEDGPDLYLGFLAGYCHELKG